MMETTERADAMMAEMNRLRDLFNAQLEPALIYLVRNERVKASILDAEEEIKAGVATMHCHWLKALDTEIRDINLAWNIELGLY